MWGSAGGVAVGMSIQRVDRREGQMLWASVVEGQSSWAEVRCLYNPCVYVGVV